MAEDAGNSGRHRLDVWLWHARCVRTRSSAAALVKAGRIRLNGTRVTSPSHPVRLGDVLTISLDSSVKLWRVTGFIERRGMRAPLPRPMWRSRPRMCRAAMRRDHLMFLATLGEVRYGAPRAQFTPAARRPDE